MDETLPPPASPSGPRETPAAAQDSTPQPAATASASAAGDGVDAEPHSAAGKLTARNAFIAAGAAVILLAAGGAYRLYQQHYADTAGEALRAKAYAEVKAQLAARAEGDAEARGQPARPAGAGKPLLRAQLTPATTPQAEPAPGKAATAAPESSTQSAAGKQPARGAPSTSRTPATSGAPPAPKTQQASGTPSAPPPQSAAAKPSARPALRAASAAPSSPPSRLGKVQQTSRNRTTVLAQAAAQVAAQVAMRPPPGVDALYQQRSRQLCESGWLGLICREVTKVQLCHEHNAYGKAAICPSRKSPLPIWSASIG